MKFEKGDNGNTKIIPEAGENIRRMLRVLLQASFALARPVTSEGRNAFDPEQMISDEISDRFISDPQQGFQLRDGGGRWCQTFIRRTEEGHYELNDHLFERDRGDCTHFLGLAKNVLDGKETITPTVRSTKYAYQGESLTKILREYCVKRTEGESDWQLRQRAFLEMEDDYIRGFEFFMGSSCVEWSEAQMLFMHFYNRPMSRQERAKFIEGMPLDPQIFMQ